MKMGGKLVTKNCAVGRGGSTLCLLTEVFRKKMDYIWVSRAAS